MSETCQIDAATPRTIWGRLIAMSLGTSAWFFIEKLPHLLPILFLHLALIMSFLKFYSSLISKSSQKESKPPWFFLFCLSLTNSAPKSLSLDFREFILEFASVLIFSILLSTKPNIAWTSRWNPYRNYRFSWTLRLLIADPVLMEIQEPGLTE